MSSSRFHSRPLDSSVKIHLPIPLSLIGILISRAAGTGVHENHEESHTGEDANHSLFHHGSFYAGFGRARASTERWRRRAAGPTLRIVIEYSRPHVLAGRATFYNL